jgi:two-component system chemotaxis response regulator CheB
MMLATRPAPPPAPAAPGEVRPVRVLVVDDSAFMRYTIGKYIAAAPGLHVAGSARDGREALDLLPRLQPDVITLDVEMPRLDGLSTLKEIMSREPTPVVMLSSLTVEGARETVQALTWGAVDFVAKPVDKANLAAVMDEVVTKIRAAAQANVRRARGLTFGNLAALARGAAPAGAPALAATASAKPTRPLTAADKVVVIGASTGGPRALNEVVPNIPADLRAAVVIVQHMPVGFTRSLAERLNQASALYVKEAEPGDVLRVGQALLAPGGFHMQFDGEGRVALNQNPTVHGVRPAIDVTMASLAQFFGSRTVAAILTGMGHDGTNGSALVRGAGGRIIAEAEGTCVVWGMPRSVCEAGHANEVLPLTEVAAGLARHCRQL